MAFSYWRTGNFGCGFRAPANQGNQGTQNNSGYAGYGYQLYAPYSYGREGWNKWAFSASCLKTGSGFPPVTGLVVLYDPSDITSLFKNAAGTTPVTADGDEVLCMKDKSGNNNHATATAGSGPIYRSGGYLDLDGGRFMVTGSIQLTDGSGRHSAAAAAYFNAVASYQNVLDADNGTSVRVSQFLRCNPSGQLETIAFNTTPGAFTDTGPSISAATGTVLSEITTATTTEAFVNGVGSGGSTATSGSPAAVASVLTIGAFASGNSQFLTGRFYGSANYQGALSANDHAQLVAYLTAKLPSANAYSLSCATGTFVLTGNAMTPSVALPAATAVFALTGSAASLPVVVPAATGAFVLSGIATGLAAKMPASTSAFSLTGNAANLNHGYPLPAATGIFTLTGRAASLVTARLLPAATGPFVLTGQAAALRVSMAAGAGTFVLAGAPTTLAVAVPFSTGAFVVSGQAAGLKVTMSAATAVFALTGNIAGLNKVGSSTLTVNPGTFAVTGIAAATLRGARLTPPTATFALSGISAALRAERRLSIATAPFNLTGNTANALHQARIVAAAGLYSITGAAQLQRRVHMSAGTGTFIMSGLAARIVSIILPTPASRSVAGVRIVRDVAETAQPRLATGSVPDRTAGGSLEDRTAVGNLQPRRAAG